MRGEAEDTSPRGVRNTYRSKWLDQRSPAEPNQKGVFQSNPATSHSNQSQEISAATNGRSTQFTSQSNRFQFSRHTRRTFCRTPTSALPTASPLFVSFFVASIEVSSVSLGKSQEELVEPLPRRVKTSTDPDVLKANANANAPASNQPLPAPSPHRGRFDITGHMGSSFLQREVLWRNDLRDRWWARRWWIGVLIEHWRLRVRSDGWATVGVAFDQVRLVF